MMIAGLCSLSEKDELFETYDEIKDLVDLFRVGIWKPRTDLTAFSHHEDALDWMKEFIEKNGAEKIITEVGSVKHLEACLELGIRNIWIGSRTVSCPFTMKDILAELMELDGVINFKNIILKNPMYESKNQFYKTIEAFRHENLTIVHRGYHIENRTESDYRNDFRWDLATDIKKNFPEIKLLLDSSHIAGETKFIDDITKIGMAHLDFDGFMIEVAKNPKKSLTDSGQILTVLGFKHFVEEFYLKILRSRILNQDTLIVDALIKRNMISERIGSVKHKLEMSILDAKVERRLFDKYRGMGASDQVLEVMDKIITISKEIQNEIGKSKG